ncbi:MAG: hypothetical protein Q4G34_00750 [Micrococcus sp.]|nr:hypothetical protein [Micrococcus sp.]
MLEIFTAIDEIPEDVLRQGDEAASRWIRNALPTSVRTMQIPRDEVKDFETQPADLGILPVGDKGQVAPDVNIANCVSTIGLTLLTGVIPITRLVKIRQVFKAAGGVTKFVTTFSAAYKRAKARRLSTRRAINQAVNEAARAAAPDARAALLDLFGITAIYGACS